MQDMPNSYIIIRGGFMIRIKELREIRGLQQKDLAIDLGVTQPTISGWESGIKVPSARNTQKIADYFHVSVDYLLGRDENEKEPASDSTDGQSEEEKEIIRLYGRASPELQAAALGMLRAAEAARTTPDDEKEDK